MIPCSTKSPRAQFSRSVGSAPKRNALSCAATLSVLLQLITIPTTVIMVQAQAATHIRVNCGGNTFVDSNSNQWTNDAVYNLGNKGNRRNLCSNTTVQNIPLNVPSTLYCSQRYFTSAWYPQPFQYNIPVPNNALYTVKLHFAELVRSSISYCDDVKLLQANSNGNLRN
jgi:Malectin domain